MPKRHSGVLGVLGALLVATLLAACGSSSASEGAAGAGGVATTAPAADSLAPNPLPERQTLTVTLPIKIEAFSQLLLAQKFGEFEAENLDIRLETMPGNEALTLLASGKADVQTGGPSTAMFNAIAGGADIVWAASNYHPAAEAKGGLWLNADMFDADGKPDPAKIKGSTIAFGGLGMAGTPPVYLVSDWLKSMGLSLKDINEQKLNGADMIVAMENGSIDGGWILDPYWLEFEGKDTAKFVVGQPDATGGYILGPSRHQKADAIAAFFRAMIRTTRTYLDGDYHNDPKVLAAIAEAVGVSPDVITKTPSLVFDQDMTVDPKVAERIQQEWFDLGVMQYDEPLPTEKYIDQSAVNQALGQS